MRHYRTLQVNVGFFEAKTAFTRGHFPLEGYVEWLRVELEKIQLWADQDAYLRENSAMSFHREVSAELAYVRPSQDIPAAIAYLEGKGFLTRQGDRFIVFKSLPEVVKQLEGEYPFDWKMVCKYLLQPNGNTYTERTAKAQTYGKKRYGPETQ